METQQVNSESINALIRLQAGNNAGLNRMIDELREVSDTLIDSVAYGVDEDAVLKAAVKIRTTIAYISKLSNPEQ